MKVFILSKDVREVKHSSTQYLETCADRKSAEDAIRGYLGLLCMRCVASMRVSHTEPNVWVVRDYHPRTGIVTRRTTYWIREVDI